MYATFINGLNDVKAAIEKEKLNFQFHNHFGFANLNLDNTGTGLTVSIDIQLINVSNKLSSKQINEIAIKYDMSIETRAHNKSNEKDMSIETRAHNKSNEKAN